MPRPELVFMGCPYTANVRKLYSRLKSELEAETPLRIVLADTATISSTDDLLEHITDLIAESAACVFDATGNNPNVSLEVGLAHALPVDFLITLSTRKPRKASAKQVVAKQTPSASRVIMADLQGRMRIEYKAFPALKDQVKKRYLSKLPYMTRWLEFEKNHKSYVPYALRVIAEIRSSGRTTAARVEAILSGSGITTTALTQALTKKRLITVRRGKNGGYFYPAK
jgi:hypothetical protein